MDDSENYGIQLQNAKTEEDMGERLENTGKTLQELLDTHTLWVSSAGQRGNQLDLSGYDLRDIDELRFYPLTAIRAMNAVFVNQNLTSASMQSAMFDYSDFRDCDMTGADLRASSFKNAILTRADLRGALLSPLTFKEGQQKKITNLSGADLRFADLRNADLRECVLMGCDLTRANLEKCDLRRADLTGAILSGTKMDGALLDDAIIDFRKFI